MSVVYIDNQRMMIIVRLHLLTILGYRVDSSIQEDSTSAGERCVGN